MFDDAVKSAASPPVALTPASGFELGRRLRELRAAVAQDGQRARVIQSKIAELNAKLVQYRMHAAVGVRRNEHAAAGILLSHASGIEARIADLQRQVAEIQTASTEKRKEIQNIDSQLLEDYQRATSNMTEGA